MRVALGTPCSVALFRVLCHLSRVTENLERFASGNSLIHRLDPRFRLVAALLLILPAALASTPAAGWTALVLGAALVLAARLPLGPALARLRGPLVFVAMFWIFLPFSIDGPPLFTLGPLTATQTGVDLALLISIKVAAILLILLALTATMPVHELGRAMQGLKVPQKLCHLLLFTYRYLHVLTDEHHRQLRSAKARGFTPRTSLHTYKTYAYLVGMLLVRSWDRSERVYKAMLSRGFTGRFHSLAEFHAGPGDRVFLALALVCGAGLVAVDLLSGGSPW